MKYDCRESELEIALRLKNQHFKSLTQARQEIERLHREFRNALNLAQAIKDETETPFTLDHLLATLSKEVR